MRKFARTLGFAVLIAALAGGALWLIPGQSKDAGQHGKRGKSADAGQPVPVVVAPAKLADVPMQVWLVRHGLTAPGIEVETHEVDDLVISVGRARTPQLLDRDV